jgi:hypothetical protein
MQGLNSFYFSISKLNSFSDGPGVQTQGFLLARKVFYCLTHAANPFYSGYFFDKLLLSHPQ